MTPIVSETADESGVVDGLRLTVMNPIVSETADDFCSSREIFA